MSIGDGTPRTRGPHQYAVLSDGLGPVRMVHLGSGALAKRMADAIRYGGESPRRFWEQLPMERRMEVAKGLHGHEPWEAWATEQGIQLYPGGDAPESELDAWHAWAKGEAPPAAELLALPTVAPALTLDEWAEVSADPEWYQAQLHQYALDAAWDLDDGGAVEVGGRPRALAALCLLGFFTWEDVDQLGPSVASLRDRLASLLPPRHIAEAMGEARALDADAA